MTDTTNRFGLPLLVAGQAQKEIAHNEALTLIDAGLHLTVTSSATDVPPPNPAIGSLWLVGTQPSGEWAGMSGRIATYSAGGWRSLPAHAGMIAWVVPLRRWMWHNGIGWEESALPTGPIAVAGQQVVGPRLPAIPAPSGGLTVDEAARGVIGNMLDALRTHGLIAI